MSASPNAGSGSGSGANDTTTTTTTSNEALKRMMKLVNAFLSKPDCSPFREPVDWRGLELLDYPVIIKKMMDLGTVKRKLERNQYKNAYECACDIRLIWSNCMTYNADGSDFWLLAKSFSRRFEDRYRKIKAEFDTGEAESDVIDDNHTGRKSTSSAAGGSNNNNNNSGNKGSDSRSSSGGASSSNKNTSSSNNKNINNNSNDTSIVDDGSAPTLDTRAKFGSNLFLLSGIELAHVIMKLETECPQALEQPLSPFQQELRQQKEKQEREKQQQNLSKSSTTDDSSDKNKNNVEGGKQDQVQRNKEEQQSSSPQQQSSSPSSSSAQQQQQQADGDNNNPNDSNKEKSNSGSSSSSNQNYYSNNNNSKMMITDYQKLEINIDEIDTKLFNQLNKYVNDKISTKTFSIPTLLGGPGIGGGYYDSFNNTGTSRNSSGCDYGNDDMMTTSSTRSNKKQRRK